jgi:hypothetical protein
MFSRKGRRNRVRGSTDSTKIIARETANFSNRFNLFLPVQFSAKNISLLAWPETLAYLPRPALHEGRFAIVTDVGCGMRWTLLAQ